MKNLSTANWSPEIEDVQVKACARQGFTSLGGTTPPCPKKHFTIFEVDSKTLPHVMAIVQLAIQLNSNELPYFACYIILPMLHSKAVCTPISVCLQYATVEGNT